MAYHIIHTNDKTYHPWYAGTLEYAQRLLNSIIESNPHLDGLLEIVEI